MVCVEIPVEDDGISEDDEQFRVTIDTPVPDGVAVGTPGNAAVTIVDSSGKLISDN